MWHSLAQSNLFESCLGSDRMWKPSTPASRELPADVWARYAAPPTPAVTWWSGAMPASGRLLHAWRHTHRARDGSLLLLDPNPHPHPNP